jgi:hypothetical protein
MTSIYLQTLLLSYKLVTGRYMPGHHYTPAKYTLQKKVKTFGNRFFRFEEHRWTHIYRVVFAIGEYENIRFPVLPYLNTGALPLEEVSEDWWVDGKPWSSSSWAKGNEDGLIWKLLRNEGRRLSFRTRWGEKGELDWRLYLDSRNVALSIGI